MKQHESGLWIPDFMDAPGSFISRSLICEIAIKYCKNHRVAIQAGGHIGIWPRKLAETFEKVITVEPDLVNLGCLRANCAPFANIEVVDGVFGAHRGKAKINYRIGKTSGAHHIATRLDLPWREVEQYTIDGYAYSQTKPVDLIMLDIEGYEFFALQGGYRYISRNSPVIVIEQNSAARMHKLEVDAAQKVLERQQYRVVDSFDEDLVMVRR